MKRFLVTTALVFCAAVSAQANATTLKAVRAPHQRSLAVAHATARTRQVGSIPRVGNFIDPDTGLHCYNTGWASVCDGGVAGGYAGPSATDEAAQDQAQRDSQDATDATNAGIAQTVQGINGP